MPDPVLRVETCNRVPDSAAPAAMWETMTLEILGLRKRFGEVQALDGVTLTVKPGEVFGFLGANGAGKTTTMRVVLGFLRADAGTVTWTGREARSWPRRTWGYLPEERGLYPRMTVIDQLVFFASLYGIPRHVARREALVWLARFRIADYADRRADSLSKGNHQKVQFIAPDPPRPGRAPHGRAVQRAGPGQRRAAQATRSSRCATAARRSSSAPTSWTWPRSCASRSRSSTTAGS